MYSYTYEKMVQDCLECINVLDDDDRDLMLRVYPNNLSLAIDDDNINEDNNQLLYIKFHKDEEEHEEEYFNLDKFCIDTNTDNVDSETIIKFIETIINLHGNYGLDERDFEIDGITFTEYKEIHE